MESLELIFAVATGVSLLFSVVGGIVPSIVPPRSKNLSRIETMGLYLFASIALMFGWAWAHNAADDSKRDEVVEYSVPTLKSQIQDSKWFAVQGWKATEKDGVWLAKASSGHFVMTVSRDKVAFLEYFKNDSEKLAYFMRLRDLSGLVGMNSDEADEVRNVTLKAISSKGSAEINLKGTSYTANYLVMQGVGWVSSQFEPLRN